MKHRVGERVLVKVNDKVSYYVTIRGIRKMMMNRKKLINSRFLQRIRWKGNEEHVVYLCSVWKKFELSEAEKRFFMKRKIFLFQSAARNVGSETVLRKMKRLFREGKKEENAGKML